MFYSGVEFLFSSLIKISLISTIYIHKLHLQLSVPPEYYHTSTTITALPEIEKNKGKQHLERMARADVNFIIYPNSNDLYSL
jgi:hypothetical protein